MFLSAMASMSFSTVFLVFLFWTNGVLSDDYDWVKDPSMCEVCKYLATELTERLDETGKSKEVLETGHGLDERNKKRFKYKTSEIRLIEALQDPHICDKIIEYNVHAEREGSLRYAKGQSETMETLHGLVNKGVKVELGIPYDMWDMPSAEVTRMQKKCYRVVERYEEAIEDWYFHNQDQDIMTYLCRERVLKPGDQACLDEKFVPKPREEIDEKKGDDGDTKKSNKTGKKKKSSGEDKKEENGEKITDTKNKKSKKEKSKSKKKDGKRDEL